MKKEIGAHPYLFPMPVLMIATYGDDGKVDVMNMAWGGICDAKMVSLNISENHKTSENMKKRGAFTLSIADVKHLKEADFFGIASGNNMPDKFERSCLHAQDVIFDSLLNSKAKISPILLQAYTNIESEIKNARSRIHGACCGEYAALRQRSKKQRRKRAGECKDSASMRGRRVALRRHAMRFRCDAPRHVRGVM